MNNVQQAIRDAAEKGGYRYRYRWWKVNDLEHSEGYHGLQLRALSEHLHDPDFWKALAKARKWEDANAWRFHWHQAVQSLSDISGLRNCVLCSGRARFGGRLRQHWQPPHSAGKATWPTSARAASGRATAAPPMSVMNLRRFMCGWPPPGKRSFGVQRRGRLQSCVRPVGAVRVDRWP